MLTIPRGLLRRYLSSVTPTAIKADVSLIARLRKETNLSVSRCKDALLANNNDHTRALAWLAEKEQELAQQKATKVQGRSAVEGLVSVGMVNSSCSVLVEVNSETDFAARNEHFVKLMRSVRDSVVHLASTQNQLLSNNNNYNNNGAAVVHHLQGDEINSLKVGGSGMTIGEQVIQTIGLLGEKIAVRRGAIVSMPRGVTGVACLGGSSGDLGRIGAVVAFRSSPSVISHAALAPFLTQMAQHIAGMKPLGLDISDDAIKGMAETEARESALLTQPFLFQQDLTVRQVLQQTQKTVGAQADSDLAIASFLRYECGEGLARAENNFAADVMSQVQKSM